MMPGNRGSFPPVPPPWHPRRSHLLLRNVHYAGPTRSPGELEIRLYPGEGVGVPSAGARQPRPSAHASASASWRRRTPAARPKQYLEGKFTEEPCELPLPGEQPARGAFCPSTIPRARDKGGATSLGA